MIINTFVMDGIHDLSDKKNTQSTDRTLFGTKCDVCIFHLGRVEGYASVCNDKFQLLRGIYGVNVHKTCSPGVGIKYHVGGCFLQSKVETGNQCHVNTSFFTDCINEFWKFGKLIHFVLNRKPTLLCVFVLLTSHETFIL